MPKHSHPKEIINLIDTALALALQHMTAAEVLSYVTVAISPSSLSQRNTKQRIEKQKCIRNVCRGKLHSTAQANYDAAFLECDKCKCIWLQYKGLCRTSKSRISFDNRVYNIRTIDPSGQERAINFRIGKHYSNHFEMKSRDAIEFLFSFHTPAEIEEISHFKNTTTNTEHTVYGLQGGCNSFFILE
ncbi:hypothetical protein [Ectopseudomonas oleovorans]|uniref:Uncharacterized protein n=1 Tax=Ectopseudomonas oleovorans TaxID=301 RepID=A0AA42TXD5_ECTOL|nr:MULTISPECIES: hypothetical protein [Pseudomonas]MDH1338209.1 hypothetical protein [Pseudomonas oleovorans]MDH1494939.1 hypothetical protein [Pseudomonas oleovorans]MDH1867175.1 hypothetical protein [Pseudomonas chengduensis]WGG20134.1 hypothetical protein N5O83_17090 [Pseudomonas oleovorans]